MLESKNTAMPDDKISFEHGEISLVNLTGFTVGRAELRPGWSWSTDVRPRVGTDSCLAAHSSYVVPGRMHVAMSDGRELELGPGDAHLVGPGHDAWVVGDEPCVTIDFIPAGDTMGGRVGRCPCEVEFRVATDDQLGHLVAALREHAKGSHDYRVSREQLPGHGARDRPPGYRHRRPGRHAGPHHAGTGPGVRRPRHHQRRPADGTGRGRAPPQPAGRCGCPQPTVTHRRSQPRP